MTLFLYIFLNSCSAAELIRRENKKDRQVMFFYLFAFFWLKGGRWTHLN